MKQPLIACQSARVDGEPCKVKFRDLGPFVVYRCTDPLQPSSMIIGSAQDRLYYDSNRSLDLKFRYGVKVVCRVTNNIAQYDYSRSKLAICSAILESMIEAPGGHNHWDALGDAFCKKISTMFLDTTRGLSEAKAPVTQDCSIAEQGLAGSV